ncbi:anchored repeat ABC transporter, substrate-binding protein [Conexibacter woesei]|uniref:Periplasmic solute binding protein n=1 Tax=Conexibacter woesei (strain DSM 14684 / CCUG 47730 / CIP 108061 / JCM 11494 / NBRC 100937 / ID131577) TaxID=469383 RepID=D3F7E2_CONWI|nr:anchored repeat ABC transporter, substrate-binding protein [Conexibacter woesei]ADB50804.1 periplasmic solute binding protein [Conexibacter woesei DSM 14684]
MRTRCSAVATAALAAVVLLALAGCGSRGADGGDGLRVVTTTEILADLVREVGGTRVQVSSLVPAGGDPHSYEPTPVDARKVAEAGVTFTNHLLLEEHALIKTIDANAPGDAPNVSLAEASEAYGAHVIPLVEDLGLDVLWLGLRVRGDGKARGAARSSDVVLRATRHDGPGRLVAYVTGALGEVDVLFDSGDGHTRDDTAVLPPAAHTHLNWAFTRPGIHRLTLTAHLRNAGGPERPVGTATFTFAVGADADRVADAGGGDLTVLDGGHADLTVDLDRGTLYAFSSDGGERQRVVAARDALIEVPEQARETIPDDERFAAVGRPGEQVHQLPQAVLGRHVHGEIDPHLWQDARNAAAYVQLIRDTLQRADPGGRAVYARNAAAYLGELEALDDYLRAQVSAIPPARRQLITTHDAFGYLAEAYDLTVAGFVVPNPAQEPSAAQVRRLTETIARLRVGAVFMEPSLRQRATVLTQVARDRGVRVCKLYGDAFDDAARSYVAMMRHNARELRRCLT